LSFQIRQTLEAVASTIAAGSWIAMASGSILFKQAVTSHEVELATVLDGIYAAFDMRLPWSLGS